MDIVIYMDKQTQALALRFEAARRDQGVTLNTLVESTSIPYASLQRMLKGGGDFPASYIFKLARELKAPASSWLSDLEPALS